MEAPRSRKLVTLLPTTDHTSRPNADSGCCGESVMISTSTAPLLPRTFLDNGTDDVIFTSPSNIGQGEGVKKSVRRGIALGVGPGGQTSTSSGTFMAWILCLAIGMMLLVTVMLSLKVHLKALPKDVYGRNDHVGDFVDDDLDKQRSHAFEEPRQQHLLQFQSRALSVAKAAVRPAVSSRVPPTKPTLIPDSRSEGSSLNGLLADVGEYDPDQSCASRGTIQRTMTGYPSSYLTERLREYESLHRKCARYADSFSNTVNPGRSSFAEECRFIVWTASSGMGNRLLSMASAFLYALLTNRVLLVDWRSDVSKLLCEPFPGSSWLLSADFPATWLEGLNETSQVRFGEQYKRKVEFPLPAFSYVHLTHTANDDDNKIFCDHGQDYLRSIPWIFMRSNNYIVPGLFFVSSFRTQLEQMFPEKESIFHLLGRYLFHPSDAVWLRINKFQNTYLAGRDKQVGIQIRTFNDTHILYQFEEQLLRCAQENGILPKVRGHHGGSTEGGRTGNTTSRGEDSASRDDRTLSVLVTSLQAAYSERLKDFYLSSPTEDGPLVAIHQASVEGWQRDDSFSHDLKAWAEIVLLSGSDTLITSGWSTFGYVAQSLAGVRPWIMYRSIDYTVPDPPCVRARSMEPCFHQPPLVGCDSGTYQDPSKILPYIQSCEDIVWGVKLIDAQTATE